jgi:hypothetical protein
VLAEVAPTNLIIDATGGGIAVKEMFQTIPMTKWRFAPVMIGWGYRENFSEASGEYRKWTSSAACNSPSTSITSPSAVARTRRNADRRTRQHARLPAQHGRIIEAPGRKHDDLAIALMLAWWGVETRVPGTLGSRQAAHLIHSPKKENHDRPENTRRECAPYGARSKGPKTEEGKAKSARNSTKHGLCCEIVPCLQNEDPAVWQRVLDTLQCRYRPIGRHREGTRRRHRLLPLAHAPHPRRRIAPSWDIAMEDQPNSSNEKYSTPTELTARLMRSRANRNLQLVSRYEAASAEPMSEPSTTSPNTARPRWRRCGAELPGISSVSERY